MYLYRLDFFVEYQGLSVEMGELWTFLRKFESYQNKYRVSYYVLDKSWRFWIDILYLLSHVSNWPKMILVDPLDNFGTVWYQAFKTFIDSLFQKQETGRAFGLNSLVQLSVLPWAAIELQRGGK